MRCACGGDSRVIDTRPDGDSIRRRRECVACGARFTTAESKIITKQERLTRPAKARAEPERKKPGRPARSIPDDDSYVTDAELDEIFCPRRKFDDDH